MRLWNPFRVARFWFSIAMVVAATNFANAASQYQFTDLGLGLQVKSLNDKGHVAGFFDGSGGGRQAFLWTPENGVQELGDLPGGMADSYAMDVNDSGAVVGFGHTDEGYRAFLWTLNNGIQPLHDLPQPTENSYAYGINNLGEVAGRNGGIGFLWTLENGGEDLGALPDEVDMNYEPVDINDDGQVLGTALSGDFAGMRRRVFLWTRANGMQDLGELPTGSTDWNHAGGINSLGQAVGSSGINPFTSPGPWIDYAFVWSAGTGMEYVGDMPGGEPTRSADAINDFGQAVGYSRVETIVDTPYGEQVTTEGHGFIWTPTGGVQDLNDLVDVTGIGWRLDGAVGINNAGQIIGTAWKDDVFHAYLLTPVPEPSALTMLWIAACGLLSIRKW